MSLRNIINQWILQKDHDYLAYDIENVEELPKAVSYHLSCYRNFTDITKIQRAQKIAADVNSRKTKSVECESKAEGPQEKTKAQLGNRWVLHARMEQHQNRRISFQNAV